MGIQLGQKDHAQVAHQCKNLDDEEGPERQELQLRQAGVHTQNDFCWHCVIVSVHDVPVALLGIKKGYIMSFIQNRITNCDTQRIEILIVLEHRILIEVSDSNSIKGNTIFSFSK